MNKFVLCSDTFIISGIAVSTARAVSVRTDVCTIEFRVRNLSDLGMLLHLFPGVPMSVLIAVCENSWHLGSTATV